MGIYINHDATRLRALLSAEYRAVGQSFEIVQAKRDRNRGVESLHERVTEIEHDLQIARRAVRPNMARIAKMENILADIKGTLARLDTYSKQR